jgi:uncharacterized protein YkwD
MNPARSEINRRSFLKAAPVLVAGTRILTHAQTPIERGRFSDDDVPQARDALLKMVNDARSAARLGRLELDQLACKVANEHALDMARGEFLSHWGSDGRKPYHRYSFAGGTDAVVENVSSADSIQSLTNKGVLSDLQDMHLAMLYEKPPNDGHRRTILSRQSTHVGFGIALQGYHLRLDELYLARYVQIDPVPRLAKTNAAVLLSGRLLSQTNYLTSIDVYHEPLPAPPAIEWLREPRSYGLPTQHDTLLPRLPSGYSYPEGGQAIIEKGSGGTFRVRVNLSRKPGINTLVIWLKASNGTEFQGSQICIRVEG